MTVLVVDDSEIILTLVDRMIDHRFGMKARLLDNPAKALAADDLDEIKLIISDHYLPGIGGIDFIELMRGKLGSRRIPTVIMSSDYGVREQVSAFCDPSVEFLPKPFSEIALHDAVKNACRNALFLPE